MLVKFIAVAFLLITAGRLIFPGRIRALGDWFRRFIDLTLVLLVLAFGAQLLMFTSH